MTQIKNLGTRKFTPDNSDLIPLQQSNGITRHIAREDLLQGVFTSTGGWISINSNYTAQINTRLIVNATSPITITLPSGLLGEIEIYNNSSSRISINLSGGRYRGILYNSSQLQLAGINSYIRLLWLDSTNGWLPLSGELEAIGNYPTGMRLWLESANLSDRSGNNNNASPINANTPPVRAIGLDNRFVFRWNGTGTQELSIPAFMAGTTSATVYCVYTVNSTQYNLIRTANLDDYWRFSSNGAGYFGVFRSARFEGYPLNMPSNGNVLVSIHASSTQQEIIVNNSARGVQSSTYSTGDRFRIATNDRLFNGDIALILVYPSFIDKASTTHQSIISAIKSSYPSLPFTL
jgi:hypothetical protein